MLLDSLERDPAQPVILNFAMSLESASIHVCDAYMPAAAEYSPFNICPVLPWYANRVSLCSAVQPSPGYRSGSSAGGGRD